MKIALIDNYDAFANIPRDLIYCVSGVPSRVPSKDAPTLEAFVSEPVDYVDLSDCRGHAARLRDIYSCAPGYVSLNATVYLNTVIRTIAIADNTVGNGMGGAIVYRSAPLDEYEEIKLEAIAQLSTLPDRIGSEVPRPDHR